MLLMLKILQHLAHASFASAASKAGSVFLIEVLTPPANTHFDCLRAELAANAAVSDQRPIRVLTVSPGYISTNLSLNAVTGDGNRYGKLDETTRTGMTVEDAAREIVDGIRDCRKEMILAGCGPRMAVILRPLIPGWYFWWAERRARKEKPKVQ